MLAGERQDLLAEWLTEATARGLRPPPQLLPALLETARANPRPAGWRRLVAEAGGPLGRWLAAVNPEWELPAPETGQALDVWRLGDASQRGGYLSALRAPRPRRGQGTPRGELGRGGTGGTGRPPFRPGGRARPGRRGAARGGA